MARGPLAYVVQCLDSYKFLKPSDDGDVDFTSVLREAGRFYDPIEADETAQLVLSGGPFDVFGFYEAGRGE